MIIRSFTSNSAGAQEKIHSTLTLRAVPAGSGTVGNDLSYRYRFSLPPIAVNTDSILTVSVEGDKNQPNTYVIHSYASTSPGITIPRSIHLPFPASAGVTSLQFDLRLRANELALLSIIVIDTYKTPNEPYDLICCDPQVANDAKT